MNWVYFHFMEYITPTTVVDYATDFIENPNELFARLWNNLAWIEHDDRPRKEYWCNDLNVPYTYGSGIGQRTYEAQPFHTLIKAVQTKLVEHTGILFEGCFVNGYAGPRQHLGWHSDDDPKIDHTKPIAVISLGDTREIWYRPKLDRDDVTKIELESGSIFLMNAGMQQTHDHRIPKSSRMCQPRISLTFRSLVSPRGNEC